MARPFYSKAVVEYTDADRVDSAQFQQLNDELKQAASALQKNQSVQFMSPRRIKDKAATFGIRLEWTLMTGTVKTPLRTVKWSALKGVPASQAGDFARQADLLKVVSGNFIYSVDPSHVETI